ncbi:MAG: hypothetical protein KBG52_03235 [Neisseria sp.]|nr:hypothetical protein [Neisseria sp.]
MFIRPSETFRRPVVDNAAIIAAFRRPEYACCAKQQTGRLTIQTACITSNSP